MAYPTTMTTLFEFKNVQELDSWRIVNDGVMGGLSQSQVEWDKENGTLIFSGNVSLENYGGFASTRTSLVDYNKGSFKKIHLRVKGDGKTYKFRMRNSNRFDGIAYSLDFETQKDTWEEIEMMVKNFEPTFRGRIYSKYGKMDTDDLQQVGFLIAGKQEGAFRLEVDWIRLGN